MTQLEEDSGPMRVGVSIIRQLSTAFYEDIGNVFEELVSNAYDAGATKVDINIQDDQVTIQDNGTGMSSEELMHFFYISHTDKGEIKKFRHLTRLKRDIIGRFGIGKLSMYRICKNFTIISWKNSTESVSDFSFEEFERLSYVDELTLRVKSGPAESRKTGTRIVMQNLKIKIAAQKIRAHLSKTMPLKPDFKLHVNEIACTAIMRIGKVYEINNEVDGYGKVIGTLTYTNAPLGERDSGIYVRVAGRVVNHNPRIIELGDRKSALTLSRRTFMDIEADWLSEAVKADRSGFILDHPKYIGLIAWLESAINKYNNVEFMRRKKEEQAYDTELVSDSLRDRFGAMATKPAPADETSGTQSHSTTQKTTEAPSNEATASSLVRITFNGKDFRVIVSEGKLSGPAWEFSNGIIILNSSHPLYAEAREMGCPDFHALNLTILAVAQEVSKDMKELRENYEKLARQVCASKIQK